MGEYELAQPPRPEFPEQAAAAADEMAPWLARGEAVVYSYEPGDSTCYEVSISRPTRPAGTPGPTVSEGDYAVSIVNFGTSYAFALDPESRAKAWAASRRLRRREARYRAREDRLRYVDGGGHGRPARRDLREAGAMTARTDVSVALIGTDGNAFAVIGTVARALRAAGLNDEAETFRAEAMATGSYDELLRVVMGWVEVE